MNKQVIPSWITTLIICVLIAVLGVGCGGATGTTTTAPNNEPMAPGRFGGSYSGGQATGDTEAGAAFARWVIEQDPRQQYITDAVVRNEQTLGVKVKPTTTKGDVQRLLVALAEGMSKTFPGKQLTVVAFYQSGDKLAEARYDPNTRQVNVQFAQQ